MVLRHLHLHNICSTLIVTPQKNQKVYPLLQLRHAEINSVSLREGLTNETQWPSGLQFGCDFIFLWLRNTQMELRAPLFSSHVHLLPPRSAVPNDRMDRLVHESSLRES